MSGHGFHVHGPHVHHVGHAAQRGGPIHRVAGVHGGIVPGLARLGGGEQQAYASDPATYPTLGPGGERQAPH